jgi:proteasome lid subunit RPN8/RPN11
MSAEIEFGEVEQPRPKRGIRPDAHPHYAVAQCGAVGPNDLPIYVDLDAMIDMEEHALSDDTVELGGVMLGGQYEDDQGRAFVVVTDCLRAKHYESTRGSFKFTHDTWSEITRQRDEYPEDTVMVGWYHTHPDWGVFLSGMDLFICNNFFNKPLDLALVIDPCRDDRGWFQWLPAGGQPNRTGGFYVMSSRFREQEVQFAAETWKEGETMFTESRRRSAAAATSVPAGGSTIVQLSDRENTWTPIILAASLILQTAVLAPLLWRLSQPNSDAAVLEKQVKALIVEVGKQHDQRELDQQRLQVEERTRAIDATLESLRVGGPDNLTRRLTTAEEERENAVTDLSLMRRAQKQMEGELKRATYDRDTFKAESADKTKKFAGVLEKADKDMEDLRSKVKERDAEIKELKGEPAAETQTAWFKLPAGYGLGIGGLLLGAMVGAVAVWVSRGPGSPQPGPENERDARPLARERTFHDEPPGNEGRSSS